MPLSVFMHTHHTQNHIRTRVRALAAPPYTRTRTHKHTSVHDDRDVTLQVKLGLSTHSKASLS